MKEAKEIMQDVAIQDTARRVIEKMSRQERAAFYDEVAHVVKHDIVGRGFWNGDFKDKIIKELEAR